MKKIVYRVDASGEGGYGHLGRSLALARHMEGEGYEPVFLLGPDQSGTSIASFGATDYTYQLPQNYGEADEIAAMRHLIDIAKPSAVVVDLLISTRGMMEMIKGASIPLLAIDDKFKNNHKADIIVSSNPVASFANYEESEAELLLGSDYLLLRPQFATTAPQKSDKDQPDKIYLSFGGSDPKNYTQRALDTLGMIGRDVEAIIVAGSGYRNYDQLLETASRSGVKANIRQGEKEPWDLMRGAKLAICAMGNTTWELMCMGVPSIVLTQNDDQARYAKELEGRGVIIHFASNNEFENSDLAQAVEELMDDSEKRRRMIDRGKKMVDGKGLARVAKALIRKIDPAG